MAPATEMFAQFNVLPGGMAIKTEVDNHAYDFKPDLTFLQTNPTKSSSLDCLPIAEALKREQSFESSVAEMSGNIEYGSDSNGADDDDWNYQTRSVQTRNAPGKQPTSRRLRKLAPRNPRCKGQKFKCDVCGKEFKNKTQLKPHFARTHKIRTRQFIPCEVCSRKFSSKKTLIKHLNYDHADRNEFHCHLCYSLFSTMELLKEHRLMAHLKAEMGSKKQSFEKVLCPHCGTIITKSCLKAHISKVHLKEKNFACTDCGKKFQTKTYLRYHIAYHHSDGAKPFQCDRCPQRYPTKLAVYKHLTFKHMDKRQNFKRKCGICSKAFISNSDLNRHLKRMHVPGEVDDGIRADAVTNMFHCTFCNHQFSGKTMLKRHLNKFHR